MMKKMLFLMLFLMFLGAANVSSQVRIGGNEKPNDAAVLDLNVDNNTNTGTKGLALPRVSLSDKTAKLDGVTANIKGMLVYNTRGSLAEGVYYWNGGTWVNTPGSYILGRDSLIGLDNARSGDVLQYESAGWKVVPGMELVSWEIICDSCLMVNSVGAISRLQPAYPLRCSPENSWVGGNNWGGLYGVEFVDNSLLVRRVLTGTAHPVIVRLRCLRTTR